MDELNPVVLFGAVAMVVMVVMIAMVAKPYWRARSRKFLQQ